jgi:hypothetical protein
MLLHVTTTYNTDTGTRTDDQHTNNNSTTTMVSNNKGNARNGTIDNSNTSIS